MAALDISQGYICEFVDPVVDEYYCKKCTLVARRLTISSCCGESFCHACVAGTMKQKLPCPECGKEEFSGFNQVKYQQKINKLQVYCSMKGRGCHWSGLLEQLDTHLDPEQDDCQYVDTKCPLNCQQTIPKNKVEQHMAEECAKRDFVCKHCNFKATYEEVTYKHLPECKYVPLQCPNLCGVTCDREVMVDHMKLCRLEEVACDFKDLGCDERVPREELNEHLREHSLKHLMLAASLALKNKEDFTKEIREQREKHEAEEQELKRTLEEQEVKLQAQEKKIEEQKKEYESLRCNKHKFEDEIKKKLKKCEAEEQNLKMRLEEQQESLQTQLDEQKQNLEEEKRKLQKQTNGLHRKLLEDLEINLNVVQLEDDLRFGVLFICGVIALVWLLFLTYLVITNGQQLQQENKDLSSFGEKLKKDLSRLEEKLKKDLSSLEEKLKKDLSSLEQTLKKDLSSLEEKPKKDLSSLEEKPKKDLSILGENLKKDLSNLGEKLKKDLSSLGQKLKKDLSNLGEKPKKDLSSLGEKLKKDLSSLGQKLNKDLSNLGEKPKKDLSSLGEKLKKDLSSLGQKLKKERTGRSSSVKKMNHTWCSPIMCGIFVVYYLVYY